MSKQTAHPPAHPLDWQAVDAALAALALARVLNIGDEADARAHIDAAPCVKAAAARFDAMHDLIGDMATATDGVDTVLELIGAAATAQNRATVYGLVADYVAAYGAASPEEMRLLERLGETLALDRLTRAALDVAARTRATRL